MVDNTVAETALLIFFFLQTNITSQMWLSGGRGKMSIIIIIELKHVAVT